MMIDMLLPIDTVAWTPKARVGPGSSFGTACPNLRDPVAHPIGLAPYGSAVRTQSSNTRQCIEIKLPCSSTTPFHPSSSLGDLVVPLLLEIRLNTLLEPLDGVIHKQDPERHGDLSEVSL